MISLLRDAFDEVKSAKMIEEDRQGVRTVMASPDCVVDEGATKIYCKAEAHRQRNPNQ